MDEMGLNLTLTHKMPFNWTGPEGISQLYFIEQQIFKTMTQKLGWTECVETDPQHRFANFLDYLEETYVIPTLQRDDTSSDDWDSSSRNWVLGSIGEKESRNIQL